MKIIIKGQIHGGKNNMGVTRDGRHYPKASWAIWRNQAVAQVISQVQLPLPRWERPLTLVANYTPQDRRRRDATALLDALFHVLEKSGIVQDDCYIKSIEWLERMPDKNNARLEFSIHPIL